jgi:hypothetical protein
MVDLALALGFFGLLAFAVTRYLAMFPEMVTPVKEVR